MIRFDNVGFAYGSGESSVPALEGVTLSVAPGESIGVLGANGSGKSTLARLANGLLLPQTGRVTVEGIDTSDPARVRDVRTTVGMVFQRPDDQIVATSVEDDVAFGPENLGLPRDQIRERVDDAIAAVGLTGLERREPHLLSGGQKQRLAIAGALAMRPRYLVFDEPTSMLDPHGRREVRDVIARLTREGRGVLLVTHDLLEAAACRRVVVLRAGRVAFGGESATLVRDPRLMTSLGLEEPDLSRLVRALGGLGVPLDGVGYTPSEVAEALWR